MVLDLMGGTGFLDVSAQGIGREGRPLRVLHVYRTYFPETQGGLQEAIRQLCGATKKLGVENTVFALAKNAEPATLMVDGVTVIRKRSVAEIASCDIGSLGSIFGFRALVREVDLVHFHYPWPFGDLLSLVLRSDKPFVVTYHSDVVRQRVLDALYSPLRSLFLRRAARLVTTSPRYAEGSEVLKRVEAVLETIPLCLDRSSVPTPSPDRVEYWRSRFGRPFFLFVGVLRYYKGLDFLMEAASLCGLPVVIAGSGPEGERLKSRWPDASNVLFVGNVEDCEKFALIDACRAVVFPSHLRSEAFGMTLLEGAMRKRALISTELGTGTSYVNLHELTGLVVPPADPAALARAMERLASCEQDAIAMGLAGFERFESMFSPLVVGTQYVTLYNRVLDRL